MAISGIISTMQIQQEAVYIVGLSSDFMNETIVKHPELLHWLPEGAQVHETMQTAMDSMYMYGRDWMIGAVSSIFRRIFVMARSPIASCSFLAPPPDISCHSRVWISFCASRASVTTFSLSTLQHCLPLPTLANHNTFDYVPLFYFPLFTHLRSWRKVRQIGGFAMLHHITVLGR